MKDFGTTRWVCLMALAGALAAGGCGSVDRWLAGEPASIREYHSARALFRKEKYADAAVGFRAWLADYRDSGDVLRPQVLYKLGECYRLTRDYDGAVKTYTTLVQLYEASPNAKVKKLVGVTKLRLDDIMPKTKPAREPEKPAGGEPKS